MTLVIVALMLLNVITVSIALALGLAAVLLAFDLLAWRRVAAMSWLPVVADAVGSASRWNAHTWTWQSH